MRERDAKDASTRAVGEGGIIIGGGVPGSTTEMNIIHSNLMVYRA